MDKNLAIFLYFRPLTPGPTSTHFQPAMRCDSFLLVLLPPIFVFNLVHSIQKLGRQPFRLSALIVLEVRHLYVYD